MIVLLWSVPLCIAKSRQSVLSREIIAVFCDIYMEYILSYYTVWRKADILALMQVLCLVTNALKG